MRQNSRALAAKLTKNGFQIVSGGTDNHLFLLSLADRNITGKEADAALGDPSSMRTSSPYWRRRTPIRSAAAARNW